MTRSDIDQAEHYSRARSLLMAMAAIILLANAALAFGEEPGRIRPWAGDYGWALMILLWLVMLATGGGLRLRGSIRRLMNDEVSLLNRSKALQAGFWAASLIGLALYFASLRWHLGVSDGIRLLVDGAVAVALIRYAWLELR